MAFPSHRLCVFSKVIEIRCYSDFVDLNLSQALLLFLFFLLDSTSITEYKKPIHYKVREELVLIAPHLHQPCECFPQCLKPQTADIRGEMNQTKQKGVLVRIDF